MRFVIVAVGRVKDHDLRSVLDDYLGRLRRYVGCDEVEIPDGPSAKVRAAIDKATSGATVVALVIEGQAMDSATLAREVERMSCRGKGVVAFLIGGADGLPADVRQKAHLRLSLSRMTFPHRLARVMLAEQLYRAMTILRGEPYSH